MARRRKKKKNVSVRPRPFCPKSMVRYDNTVIQSTPIFVCRYCMKALLSTEAAISHDKLPCPKRIINPPKPVKLPDPSLIIPKTHYKCNMCPMEFARQVKLNHHIVLKHNTSTPLIQVPKETKKHKCDMCEKVYAHKSSIKTHILKVHKPSFNIVNIEVFGSGTSENCNVKNDSVNKNSVVQIKKEII